MDGKGLFGGDGRGVSSTEPVLGEVLRGDAKTGSLRLPGADANPFQEQLNEASQRLRNAQLDVMRSGGARAKMELQIAQQAFQTAHTLAITFDSKKPSQTPPYPIAIFLVSPESKHRRIDESHSLS